MSPKCASHWNLTVSRQRVLNLTVSRQNEKAFTVTRHKCSFVIVVKRFEGLSYIFILAALDFEEFLKLR